MGSLSKWMGHNREVQADLISKVEDWEPELVKGFKRLFLAGGKQMDVNSMWVQTNNPQVGKWLVADGSNCKCLEDKVFKKEFIKVGE